MPRVSVTDLARCDGRLRLAGDYLGLQWERLGWRLTGVWSLVTEMCATALPRELVAKTLSIKTCKVDGLIRAGLADDIDQVFIDLSPMQSLFGRPEWLAEIRETARDGGGARAVTADRDSDGRMLPRDYRADILAALAESPARSGSELASRVRGRKRAILRALAELMDNGQVVKDKSGCLVPAGSRQGPEPVPGTAHETAEPVPGTSDGTGSGATVPSVLAPALAPTLAPASEQTGAHTSTGTTWEPVPGAVPGTGSQATTTTTAPTQPAQISAWLQDQRDRYGFDYDDAAKATNLSQSALEAIARGERQPTASEVEALERLVKLAAGETAVAIDSNQHVLRSQRRAVAKALWRYQDEVRQHVVSDAPALKMNDLPGGNIDPIVLILANWTPAECKHALDMAGIEAEYRKDAGMDPLQFLNGRTNWKTEQFERNAQATEDQIRARFNSYSARGHGSRRAGDHERPRKLKRVG